jgi:hypothetical protein
MAELGKALSSAQKREAARISSSALVDYIDRPDLDP